VRFAGLRDVFGDCQYCDSSVLLFFAATEELQGMPDIGGVMVALPG